MAGRIPQSFINDLLARVDIVDVIDARVTLKKAGKNYQARCPFHDEKTPSFSVSPDKQFYHCFGCGVSGTALTFLMEHDRMEFPEAVEALARLVGVEVPREQNARPQQDHTDLYGVLGRAETYFKQQLRQSPEAVAYLKQRGLTGVIARDFNIGYAPDEWQGLRQALASVSEKDLLEAGLLTSNDSGRTYDRFRGRIVFPIRDTRGRVIGFGGRVLEAGDGPKYLNSPETPVFHKGRELYGLFEARKALRQIDRLLVVEGYMDVVALVQAGIAGCVASLGTATTTEHFHKLWRYTGEVICCFDGDTAGRQAAWRALESALPTLSEGRQLKFMFLPEGEDPDSLVRARGKQGFLDLTLQALPAIEYLFDQLSDGLELGNLDGQAKLASLVVPHIERVPEGILNQLMRNRLAALTGLAPGAEPRPAPGRAQGARAATGPQLSVLGRRLLGYLLKDPGMLAKVPGALFSQLLALQDTNLFLDVVSYVAKNPETDAGEILGRWSGEACHAELLEAANRAVSLNAAAVSAEFVEGVTRYLALTERAQRKRLLAQVKQDPTHEAFERFWTLKSASKVDSGNSTGDAESK